jgi:Fe-S-cluster containining protein
MGKKESLKEKPEVMACRRCGVCCTRHQAFVEPDEIARIVDYLGISPADWDRLYGDPRWRYSEWRLIRHIGGGCAFLRYENGLAACEIHAVKPACCAAWEPGPDRPECREGERLGRGQPAGQAADAARAVRVGKDNSRRGAG